MKNVKNAENFRKEKIKLDLTGSCAICLHCTLCSLCALAIGCFGHEARQAYGFKWFHEKGCERQFGR